MVDDPTPERDALARLIREMSMIAIVAGQCSAEALEDSMAHLGGGYLHGADDDGPYDVDGVRYCGRCHGWTGSKPSRSVNTEATPSEEGAPESAHDSSSSSRVSQRIREIRELAAKLCDYSYKAAMLGSLASEPGTRAALLNFGAAFGKSAKAVSWLLQRSEEADAEIADEKAHETHTMRLLKSAEREIESLKAALELLTAGDEPGVWPCGCQERVDGMGNGTPLENEARCAFHQGQATALAAARQEVAEMREAVDAVNAAVRATADHTQWFPSLAKLLGLSDLAAARLRATTKEQSECAIAERIARQAHEGQKDTVTGASYITHVERVVAMVGTEQARAVAWLHDVLEDSDFTAAELRRAGISNAVLDAVELLTKPDNETSMVVRTYAQYIDVIAQSGNALARLVKLADLRDHMHANCPTRLIDRYERAWKTLTGEAPPGLRATRQRTTNRGESREEFERDRMGETGEKNAEARIGDTASLDSRQHAATDKD